MIEYVLEIMYRDPTPHTRRFLLTKMSYNCNRICNGGHLGKDVPEAFEKWNGPIQTFYTNDGGKIILDMSQCCGQRLYTRKKDNQEHPPETADAANPLNKEEIYDNPLS